MGRGLGTLEGPLLALLLIIEQICCCLPLLAHAVEGRLFDVVVVIRYPAGVPVLLACIAINTIANVMACERKGPLNKPTSEKIHFPQSTHSHRSPPSTPIPKWLTMLFSEYFICRGKKITSCSFSVLVTHTQADHCSSGGLLYLLGTLVGVEQQLGG